MILSELRTLKKIEVVQSSVQESEASLVPLDSAADVDESAEEDDDLDYTYELDEEGIETLEATYSFLDDLITWILCETPDIPHDLVKRLQITTGDIHSLINEFKKFRPQDIGYPDILTTLQDSQRKGGAC